MLPYDTHSCPKASPTAPAHPRRADWQFDSKILAGLSIPTIKEVHLKRQEKQFYTSVSHRRVAHPTKPGQSHEGKRNRCNRFTPPLQGGTVVYSRFPRATPWAIFDSSLRDEPPAGIQQVAIGWHSVSRQEESAPATKTFMRLPCTSTKWLFLSGVPSDRSQNLSKNRFQ
jgi:hypothetical protein